MAVPNAGQIRLSRLAKERFFRDYGYGEGFPDKSISLRELSISSTVFPYSFIRDRNNDPIYPLINTSSPSHPNSAAPYAMSEFLNYNEDYIGVLSDDFVEVFRRDGSLLESFFDLQETDENIVIFENFLLGIPQERITLWERVDIPIDEFRSVYIRPYVVFKQSVAGQFRNDVAVSGQWVFLDSDRSPILGSGGEYIRWESKPNYTYTATGQWANSLFGDTSTPESALGWKDIAFDEDLTLPSDRNDRWSIDAEDTASNDTGPQEDAIYSFSQEIWVTSEDDRGYADRIDSFGNRTKWFYYESSGNVTAPKYNWFRFEEYLEVPSNASYVTFAYNATGFGDNINHWQDDYLQIWFDVNLTGGISPPPTFP